MYSEIVSLSETVMEKEGIGSERVGVKVRVSVREG
jgi:hypothetical protein